MVDNIARVGLAGSRDENQMEKRLASLRPFNEHRGKTKFCAHCSNVSTQEALFEVDWASLIEKYCDICVKKIK
jgi:hypothetical protein